MMNAVNLFNEKNIEIHDNGISVKESFFDTKEIVNTFNELIIVSNFIKNQSEK